MPVQTSYPGVYIEERPSGVRTITGVSTSVTAFVGACGFGDVNRPVRVTSIADYQRRFGPPVSAAEPMGHMVGHYFTNGGSEAIIVRVAGTGAAAATATLQEATPADTLILAAASPGTWANPVGSSGLTAAVDHATANPDDSFNLTLRLRSVNPATGNVELTAEERFENVSMSPASQRFVNLVLETSDLVDVDSTSPAPGGTAQGTSTGVALPASNPVGAANSVLRLALDFGPPIDLTIAAGTHTRDQLRTAVENAVNAAGLAITVTLASNALVLQSDATGPNSSVVVLPAPLDASATLRLGRTNGGVEVSGAAALRPTPGTTAFDGGAPGAAVVATDVVPASGAGGIFSLNVRTFPRFNLLVLPGVTSDDQQEVGAALAYCRAQRAFLIVDTPAEASPGDWITDPPALGSLPAQGEHGALYYPRLTVFETRPGGRREELDLPPAGAIAGVFATTDRNRGVWKAPAGRGAGIVGISDLTTPTDDDLSGQLNPRGVNVLRSFPGAGTVVWGARTLRGDDVTSSEFKYVPIRRTTDFIASSLYLGTAFAVFEPNDPTLWAQLRLAVETFMRRLFLQGAFQQSAKRAESDSFFVICDETVNPQAEIDLGRVNIVVGFAPLKPAEFVIVTITQISALEE
jgi:phage tail sheath protein FI